MTLFFIVAAVLVLLALILMLPAIIGDRADGRSEQLSANVLIARERRVQLDNALATAAIDEATHQREAAAIELELARELASHPDGEPASAGGGRLLQWGTAIVLALFVPLASALLYINLGDPGAIDRDRTPRQSQASNTNNGAAQADDARAPALADLLPNLEARLAENPEDVMGWRLLGRTYLTIGDFGNAAAALKRALQLEDDDVDTLAQLAEATAMNQGGGLAGEPVIYLEKALGLNDQHGQTLWLLGIARQQAGKHEESLELLQRLRDAAQKDGNSDAIAAVEDMMNRSREALGLEQVTVAAASSASAPASQPPSTTPDEPLPETDTASESGLSIQVQVSLSDEAASDTLSTHAVFVYARASNGPPMPLAVARLTVADLPATVTLDESMSMIPNMTIAAFPNVTVGARISKSGDPVGQSGDWFHEQEGLDLTQQNQTAVEIDTQKP